MGFKKKNLADISRIDCPCGYSRRPFSEHFRAYSKGSFHGTIFTEEKRAYPHFHVPTESNPHATHETYFVTSEETDPGAFIYLGKGAIEAKPGVLVNVHPGVVHGGTGDFTPLILGSPGFEDEGVVEVVNGAEGDKGFTAWIDRFYESGRRNIIGPPSYVHESGLQPLTAESPVLSFEHLYNKQDTHILIAQTQNGAMYAGSFRPGRIKEGGFTSLDGPAYIMVRSGTGEIKIGTNQVPVKPLDVLLVENETVRLGEGLATTIMAVNCTNPKDLAHGAILAI